MNLSLHTLRKMCCLLQVVDSPFDTCVIALGALVMLFSLLGLLAANHEKVLLLKVYAGLLSLCAWALFIICCILLVSGLDDIQGWFSGLDTQQGAVPPRTLKNLRALVHMLQEHRLLVSATMVLMLFLIAMNISMVWSLRLLLVAEQYHYGGITDQADSLSDAADDIINGTEAHVLRQDAA